MVEQAPTSDRKAQKDRLISYMQVAHDKYKEFAEAILDVEYNSREEWQRHYELHTTPRFVES